MPGPSHLRGKQVNIALACGKLKVDDIDICVRRILHFINKSLPQGPYSPTGEQKCDPNEKENYLREAASASIVLLKNDNSLLPFRRDKSVSADGKFIS